MKYSIRELSELAGVSARTLRYYDQIGLLKPLYTNEAGYRYYGEKEVALLQQILFYRARGFELRRIQQIVYHNDFDIMQALEEHLLELEEHRAHTEALIDTVKQTILAMKGEIVMSDKERFSAFKERVVKENEDKYGTEIREKYGSEQIDASNKRLLNMSEKDWEQFKSLENEIYESLKAGVLSGIKPDSDEAGRIAALHKEWLCMTWKHYSADSHKGIAAMYIADERFKQYYDKEVSGCAQLLEQAVGFWADNI